MERTLNDSMIIVLGRVSDTTAGCPGYRQEYLIYLYERPKSELGC